MSVLLRSAPVFGKKRAQRGYPAAIEKTKNCSHEFRRKPNFKSEMARCTSKSNRHFVNVDNYTTVTFSKLNCGP